MIFFKRYIGDYRRDASHLSLLEHGAYQQLLDQYYIDESPLPNDVDLLCRKVMARTSDEREAVARVLAEFFELTDDGFRHARCDREIAEYNHRAETARENGRRGGRRPATPKTESVASRVPSGIQPATESGAEGKASQNQNQSQKKESAARQALAFAEFWNKYPRKVSKAEAQKAWMRLAPDADTVEQIMAGLARHCASRQWTKDNGEFIPHASTWLNQQRWTDEIDGGNTGGSDWDEGGML